MAYELLNPQPGPRDDSLGWDDLGPGLYNDETALVLDSGELIAVSVVPKWMENGSGVAFTGWARWIEADGQTHLCQHGQHVETAFTYHAIAVIVDKYGIPFIAKEMLHMLLGEPLTMVEDVDQDGNPMSYPTLMWSDEVRLNASIRHALKSVSETGPLAINAANLLGF
jgi:hypothetical protein